MKNYRLCWMGYSQNINGILTTRHTVYNPCFTQIKRRGFKFFMRHFDRDSAAEVANLGNSKSDPSDFFRSIPVCVLHTWERRMDSYQGQRRDRSWWHVDPFLHEIFFASSMYPNVSGSHGHEASLCTIFMWLPVDAWRVDQQNFFIPELTLECIWPFAKNRWQEFSTSCW